MPKQKFQRKNIARIQNSFCTYKFYDSKGTMIQVGSSRKCGSRLKQHFGKVKAKYFSARLANSWDAAHSHEKIECKNKKPKLNHKCG